MISSLRITDLGPIASAEYTFDPRLTLLTGDSFSGKTFVLNALFFGLTGSFPCDRIPLLTAGVLPIQPEGGVEAVVRTEFGTADGNISIERTFGGRLCVAEPLHQEAASLVILARADGSVLIADPCGENGDDLNPRLGFRFLTFEELVDGKLVGTSCSPHGLVNEFVLWSMLRPDLFRASEDLVRDLFPADCPTVFGGILDGTRESVRRLPTVRRRITGHDGRQIETEVPMTVLPLGRQRWLALAYAIVLCADRHRRAAARFGIDPLPRLTLLIDEPEAHCSARDAAGILPALRTALDRFETYPEIQVVAASSSESVLAGLEKSGVPFGRIDMKPL